MSPSPTLSFHTKDPSQKDTLWNSHREHQLPGQHFFLGSPVFHKSRDARTFYYALGTASGLLSGAGGLGIKWIMFLSLLGLREASQLSHREQTRYNGVTSGAMPADSNSNSVSMLCSLLPHSLCSLPLLSFLRKHLKPSRALQKPPPLVILPPCMSKVAVSLLSRLGTHLGKDKTQGSAHSLMMLGVKKQTNKKTQPSIILQRRQLNADSRIFLFCDLSPVLDIPDPHFLICEVTSQSHWGPKESEHKMPVTGHGMWGCAGCHWG